MYLAEKTPVMGKKLYSYALHYWRSINIFYKIYLEKMTLVVLAGRKSTVWLSVVQPGLEHLTLWRVITYMYVSKM